jgi:prepilin-type N-terminal cleavage/methylation domain-containing protein
MPAGMSSRGFAMSEVLAALAVLGVIVAGNLGLALGGLGATLEARRAQRAVAMAADLAGRVRALPSVDWAALPAAGACPDPCAPEQLAAAEWAAWSEHVAEALPGGAAELAPDGAGALVLSIRWQEQGGEQRVLRLGMPR